MFLLDATAHTGSGTAPARPDLVFSASDLVTASECGYRLLRILDEKLGRAPRAEFPADPLLRRAAALGDVHEHRVLEALLAEHGPWSPANPAGVYDVEPAGSMDRATLEAKHEESLGALRSGASVVFQAAFFDGRFHGRSDFLVRRPDGSYAVWDTKLARHAKVGALLQLAAYGDQLEAAGIPTSSEVTLVLGDGTSSVHSLPDLLPVFRERRDRFLELVGAHRDQPDPVRWGDAVEACGRCDHCAEQVTATRDLLLVAGMTTERRARLRAAGVRSIDALAALDPPPREAPLLRLWEQARQQMGLAPTDGGATHRTAEGTEHTISYRVLEQHTLAALPAPSPGDIFFDFEGDPLWQDPGSGTWGLEYLFGLVERPEDGTEPVFLPFWAHSRAEERLALRQFLDHVAKRRERHPDLHIYHYAPYEKTALRRLSLQHVLGEDAVDTLLREGVLIDLYDTVRRSLRVSERSYGLKKLEPLFLGSEVRTGGVTDAGASVVAYAAYCAARDAGNDGTAAEILASIGDYNRYDCVSTLALRNWLVELGAEFEGRRTRAGVSAGPAEEVGRAGNTRMTDDDAGTGVGSGRGDAVGEEQETSGYGPAPEETRLLEYLAGSPTAAEDPARRAVALVAAAVGYHRREDKQFWWSHFDRLAAAVEEWEGSADVFGFDTVEVVEDWARPTPRSNPVRTLQVTGRLPSGTDFRAGGTYCTIYPGPAPEDADTRDGGSGRGGWFGAEVTELAEDGVVTTALVREKLRRNTHPRAELPLALAPDRPLSTASLQRALVSLAGRVGDALPELPAGPALDLLTRTPPRLRGGASLPAVEDRAGGHAATITAALKLLTESYLAVQGPPGTGKTHVGAAVIAQLVEDGWKVGVVAQSHAVVENLLRRAVGAGVPPARVAKRSSDPTVPWGGRTDNDVERLLGEPGGCLIGGTAWTLTGSKVPAGVLDLLVIDEAGQFSLANTLAVAQASSRLLLLGDPRQLPQVTQGTHPEPVDHSALGWLSAGSATLPPRFGYFLAETWRMHPDLCRAVSVFAYEGRLTPAPVAAGRRLAGVAPGVACVLVDHVGNVTSSPEEALEVVHQVQWHLGRSWIPEVGAAARPLAEADILVVAAYNAQVHLVRHALVAAGLPDVRVGTVDRFQGQQAAVVLVSMAASSAAEAPRGVGFLLNRNRINVAVSRGQWRAVVIRSSWLTHHLPHTPAALEELGAFIGLCTPEV